MCRFSEEFRTKIWEKASTIDGYDPSIYRQDVCGAWIMRDKYNDRTSDFGWEIDHVYPQKLLNEKGATIEEIDNVLNLRPMNWRNNVSKGTDFPIYRACITSEGNKNIKREDEYQVNSNLQAQLSQIYSKYL